MSTVKDKVTKKPSGEDNKAPASIPRNELSKLVLSEKSGDRSRDSGDKSRKCGEKCKLFTLRWWTSILPNVITGLWDVFKWYYPEPDKVASAAEEMKAMTVVFEEPEHFALRKAVKERIFHENPNYYTLVIAGQDGVGKTTAVLSSLNAVPGVAYVSCVTSTKVVFETLLEGVGIAVGSRDPIAILTSVLQAMKLKGYKKPVIVVDVSKAWTSKEFATLLDATKYLGADLKLARFILVANAELSSHLVAMNHDDLRCEVYYVPKASEEEAKWFLVNSMSSLKNESGEQLIPDAEKDQLVKIALDSIDRRFSSLVSLFLVKPVLPHRI